MRTGSSALARSTSLPNNAPCSYRRTSGSTTLGRRTFSTGAITVAVPSMTTSPRWFTQRQSSEIRLRPGSFAAALTETAITSPTITG